MVDQDADLALGAGFEVDEMVGEIVDAAEVLHHHTFDAQVVTPDLLDQFGVVAALDEDPAGAGDAGLGAVDRDRAARGHGGGSLALRGRGAARQLARSEPRARRTRESLQASS